MSPPETVAVPKHRLMMVKELFWRAFQAKHALPGHDNEHHYQQGKADAARSMMSALGLLQDERIRVLSTAEVSLERLNWHNAVMQEIPATIATLREAFIVVSTYDPKNDLCERIKDDFVALSIAYGSYPKDDEVKDGTAI